MTNKHTREPWTKDYLKGDTFSSDRVIIREGDKWIATVHPNHIGTIWSALNGIHDPVKAAALKLLEALTLAQAKILESVGEGPLLDKIDNAIAEATGGK